MGISDEDCKLITDAEHVAGEGRYRDAALYFLQAGKEAREEHRDDLDRGIFDCMPAGLEEDLISDYIRAREERNEIGMERAFNKANPVTKRTIIDWVEDGI